jgi:hypothetical protein
MKIANPMYDVVFKYLIEDLECAKLLLGEIIQQEIIECELLHNEIASEAQSESGVLKMDFKAMVKTKEEKHLLVIIEVQKALKETNLLRFRQYLGSQYSNKNNCYSENDKKIPLPIFSIYFLGYNIGLDNKVPIIKVSPKSFDYTEGSEIKSTSTFTDSLSHEMVIIQTKVLKNSQRSLLEGFLSNFMPEVQQFLVVNPGDFDRKFVSLLKRLEKATMKKEIVELMQRENLIQEEWENMVRSIAEAKQRETEAKQREMEMKIKVQEEQKQKDEIIKMAVLNFRNLGLGPEEISKILNLPKSQIENLMST